MAADEAAAPASGAEAPPEKRPRAGGEGGAGPVESAGDAAMDPALCGVCAKGFGSPAWMPHIRVPVEGSGDGEVSKVLCHFWCVIEPPAGIVPARPLSRVFREELQALFKVSPELKRRDAIVRYCEEEHRFMLAAEGHPLPLAPLPPPPPCCWAFESIIEIRIATCSELCEVPAEIGLCHGMRSLVLISNALVTLPEEIGALHQMEQLFLNGNLLRSLPDSMGTLPRLKELCLDANQLESVPPITSRCLEMFSAPGNKLVALPRMAGRPQRLEVHGNRLQSLMLCKESAYWDTLMTLKVMGNQLVELPDELALMKGLRVLNVSSNRLRTLPDAVTRLESLEWLYAFGNELAELPRGVLRCGKWLERACFEDNPLTEEALAELLDEVAAGSPVRLLGLDEAQARRADDARRRAAPSGECVKPLPECVSVGSVVPVAGDGQYFMKLARASQLHRVAGVHAAGEASGPESPEASPAELLVVAFAASQGEPEWSGVLRRLAMAGRVSPQPPPAGALSLLLPEDAAQNPEERFTRLWSKSVRSGTQAPASCAEGVEAESLPLVDFDVLTVVDHRMRWYSEEAKHFHSALQSVTQRYRRTIFLGASMGGFGAMLHGSRLADAVLAFGPQTVLSEATLRPPAEDVDGLRTLERNLVRSLARARARGAVIEIHSAADEHLWHALGPALADAAVTVHPLMPRKPFARILDQAGLLMGILSDALYRVSVAERPAAAVPDSAEAMVADTRPLAPAERLHSATASASVILGCWTSTGALCRYHAKAPELIKLFYGPGAPVLPRPGDWFCLTCNQRNMSSQFFCHRCGGGDQKNSILNPEVPRVSGGREYPRKGDWGCRKCCNANGGKDTRCSRCWAPRDGPEALLVE